jgi:hypothetical protein
LEHAPLSQDKKARNCRCKYARPFLRRDVLGAALVFLGIARTLTAVHPLVMFWWVFWVGIIVAVLAFWSALYNHDSSVGSSYQR